MRPESLGLGASDRARLRVTPTGEWKGLRLRRQAESRRTMLTRLLYDAALHRTSWALAVVEVVGLFRGSGGYLVLRREAAGRPGAVVDGWAFAPPVDGRTGSLFPAGTVLHGAPVGGPVGDAAAWTAAALRAVDGAAIDPATVVHVDAAVGDGISAELVVRRPRALGPLGPREQRLAGWLETQLLDALSLHVGVRRLHAENLLYRRVLDTLSRAVFLVDADGRIVHANAAAGRVAAALDAVRTVGGILAVGDAATQAELRRAIEAASGPGADGLAPVDMQVPLDGRPRPLLVRIVPADPDARAAETPEGAAALVEMRDMNAQPAMLAETLQSAFCLSRAEAEIALAVADGQAPKAIARDRGVAPSTIRTQLLSIYRKCHLSRQGELSAMVTRLVAYGGFQDAV